MPAVLLPLRSNVGYVEISELRQERIKKADLNDPQSARDAIARMGVLDRLHDWLFLDGAKETALHALATIVIARHAGPTPSDSGGHGDIREEARLAHEVFLDLLSPQGLRAVLADWCVCGAGYSFSPKSYSFGPKVDRAVNDLLTFTLPADKAGKFLKRAGMFDRAALAFNEAATSAQLDGRLDEALAHFEKVADLWAGIGSHFRAWEAKWHQAHLFKRVAMRAEEAGASHRAAEAYENEARAWRERFDFTEEGEAWRRAQDCWLDAAEAAQEAGDETAADSFLQCGMEAGTGRFIASERADAALRVEVENRRQRIMLGHV